MRNRTVFIRKAIYDMKMSYGFSLDIYTIISSVVNLQTGRKTVDKKKFHIRRAVILPETLTQDKADHFHTVMSNRDFPYGGKYNKGKRTFLIDAKDLPKAFSVGIEDYIVYDNIRYTINTLNLLDHKQAYIIVATKLEGETPGQILEEKVEDSLPMNQGTLNG